MPETLRPNEEVVVSRKEVESGFNYFLSFGNKLLRLTVYYDTYTAEAWLSNHRPGLEIPGTTTTLFSASREILEQFATQNRRGIDFTFSTSNPKLVAWALDPEKGEKVFAWDKRDPGPNGGFVATKHISPQKLQPF